ncbi:MAG: hypothetical protein KME21_30260 [Desmonostoc vinosum HA7617-LM4]|nr:hypothetical protein [Desmonostoc vinosum HA7617-LM4]
MLIKTQFRWRRVLLAIAIGTIAAFAIATASREWQVKTQSWCIRFSSSGTQKVLYGYDCRK